MTRGAREPDIIDEVVRVVQELDPTLTAEALRRGELAARREFGGRKYYIRIWRDPAAVSRKRRRR